MTLAEKLAALNEAKKNALLAINAKGIYVPTTFPFRRYGEKIMEIPQSVTGEGVGPVIAPPSGAYQQQIEVWLSNGFLHKPRFYVASTVAGPYKEVLVQPIILTEDTELYTFASDLNGEVFTSIHHFMYSVLHEGLMFTDVGALGSVCIMNGKEAVEITKNTVLGMVVEERNALLHTVNKINGNENVEITFTTA